MQRMRVRYPPVAIGGAGTALLGVVHCAATGVVLPPVLAKLPPGDALAMAYMFIATGVAVFYLGGLIWYSARHLQRGAAWAHPVCLSAAICATLLGAGAVAPMPDNPFAYLMLALALLTLVPLLAGSPRAAQEAADV
jgi:hypothetical protein